MVRPLEFHKGRGRLWGEATPRAGQGRGATRRDRRDPDSQPYLASGLFGGRRPSSAATAILVNLLVAALSGASNGWRLS